MYAELDNHIALIGAVIRLAIQDAKCGDSGAIHFLAHVFPEWEETERRYDSADEGRTNPQLQVMAPPSRSNSAAKG